MSEPLTRAEMHVLLVDDEENILRSLERLLMDEEYSVITATSGEQGLRLLADSQHVALIVSDQRMPGMGGAEFLGKAREVAPDAVRMILTGYADVTAAMDAINKGGAARYLAKPWDEAMLIQAIRDGVDYYLVLMENRRLAAVVQQQNQELAEWNTNLKGRVMEQTIVIRKQIEELSVRNARINEAFSGIIQSFSRLVEMASPRLHSHARNVTALSVAIAKDLELPSEEQETIRIAALLHDIGVVGLPDAVLAKRTKDMTADELLIYKQHSVRGQAAIDAVPELRDAGLLIRHHHEQYNGSGYPDRLIKNEIPRGARIIGFADYLDLELGEARGPDALDAVFSQANLQVAIRLDPHLLTSAKKCAKYVYFTAELRLDWVENEYAASELISGMQVTRDICCGTGILLVPHGTILDRHMIESIKRYYDIDPPPRGVYAIVPRK